MSTLRLFLLGTPRVEHDGAAIKLPRQKSLALLVYLAVTGCEHSREKLAALLWPESNERQARRAVRTALSDIRRAVDGEHLVTGAESVALNPAADVWTDVGELERRAHGSSSSSTGGDVVPLRMAPFLEGFNLKDAPEYDNWAFFERDRLLQLAIKYLHRQVEACEARGAVGEAIAIAQQLLGLDNLHEETHRRLMRLYYAAGDRAAALRQYETARGLLARELSVEPMEETRDLYEQILSQALPAVHPYAAGRPASTPHAEHASPAFVFAGRAAELAVLRRAWEAAGNGQARAVFVEGEAGAGKTRLVQEFISSVAGDALVLTSRSLQAENGLPYYPFVSMLRDYFGSNPAGPDIPNIWLSEISRLVPELRLWRPDLAPALPMQAAQERSGLLEAELERTRLFEAIRQLFSGVAAARPSIVFFDDLHWADPATLALLGHLATTLASARLLVVGTYRGAETNADLENLQQSLSRAGVLVRLALDRLSYAEVREMVGAAGDGGSEAFCQWLHRETEGNPFFIQEVIAYLVDNSWVPDGKGGRPANLDHLSGALPGDALPSGISDLVRARLRRLSETARQLLDVAAIIGHRFDFATLRRAGGKDEDAALDALDELRRTQLVSQNGDLAMPYEFTHTKIREVLLKEMSLARQQILHRRAGEALEITQRERIPEIAGELACHFRTCGAWDKAAHYALSAGERAAGVFAQQEAIDLYGVALESLSHLDDRKTTAAVYMGRGDAYRALGRPDRAIEDYEHALALWQALGEGNPAAEARFRQGLCYLLLGEYRQAAELAQTNLQHTAILDANTTGTSHKLLGISLSMEGYVLGEAKAHLREAIRLFALVENYGGLCHAQFELGNVLAQEGEWQEAVSFFEDALASAVRSGAIHEEALACNNAAYHTLLLGDVARARQLAERGLRLAEANNLVPALIYLYSTVAEILFQQEQWGAAEDLLDKGLALAQQVNSPERCAGYLAGLAEIAYGRGDWEKALAQMLTAIRLVDRIGVRFASARYHLRLARMLGARGCAAEAQIHWQRAHQIALESSYRRLLEEAEQTAQHLAIQPKE